MNNLLIAIAVFIITVVGALFAIPYFVDWNSYRSVFEEEASREVRAFCQRLLADPDYRANLERRWRKGSLPPALEQMVWAYAIGRPPQSLDVTSRGPSLASLIAGTADDDDDDDTDAQH